MKPAAAIGYGLFVVGLPLSLYGKYFRDVPYRWLGIVISMIGVTILLTPWRKKSK